MRFRVATVIATSATRYATHPVQKAREMPKNSAITTANTDAHTESAPLMPQRNAVGAPGR